MSATTRRIGFKLGPRLLDHTGLAMYSSIPKAISELVANSYDANAIEVRINVSLKDDAIEQITIADNGDGMSPEELENRYLALGYNRRDVVGASTKRKPIGSKGIGKLAGLGIAKIGR